MTNSVKKAMGQAAFTRRTFLAGSAGGSLVMAFGGTTLVSSAIAAVEERKFAPTIWFEIDSMGAVTVNVTKAEMGQHVGTALARIVADELGADWNSVKLAHVDSHPKWGFMVTGGSWSVFTSYKPLSQAAAAGRQVLIDAAAKMMNVPASECLAAEGRVSAGSQSVSFADIVQRGEIDRQFTAEELEAMPIKPASQRTLVGKPTTALDVPAKSSGEAVYGIDAEVDGMIYGRPLIPPTRYGSSVNSVDDSAAKSIDGYVGHQVLNDPSGTLQGWVVALADSFWAAKKAADAIEVDWTPGETTGVDEDAILAEGERLAEGDGGALFVDDGDVDAASAAAASTIDRTYKTHSALHLTLEPQNAVAYEKDGHWHIHSGNQWQSLILPVLAKALEVEETDITIHTYYLGGGYGRRLFGDYMLPAVLASKAVGKPVKVVFTREDDSRFDCVRSASVQRFQGSLDGNGKVTGIEHAAVAGWPTLTMAPGFMPDGKNDTGKLDPFSANGSDHWYTVPNHRVRIVNNELAQKTFLPGWLRAVGPGWIGFGVESFMDELAHEAGQDPLDFRLAMLDASGKNAGAPGVSDRGADRLREVLSRMKVMSGWGRSLPADEGMGVAVTSGQERTMPTWGACVAHVAVDRASGKITVKKMWQLIDCGTAVHPDGALAQAEGASLWGMSLALHEGTRFKDGQVSDLNLDTYSPLRMADMPELDIRFLDGADTPTGMGEPPLIPVAPAIANAVYSAVGVRLRTLPMRPEDVKAGLA